MMQKDGLFPSKTAPETINSMITSLFRVMIPSLSFQALPVLTIPKIPLAWIWASWG
jgi:hypothetical protein